MKKIEVVRLDAASQVEKVLEIAQVYKEVFGSEPWNEGFICPGCVKDNIYPLSFTQRLCPVCLVQGKETELKEFWPIEQIVADFKKEMLKIGSVCYVAQEQGKIVGFAWGYQLFVDRQIDQYLDSPGLSSIIYWSNFLYIDEVAVLPGFRKLGIGKKLVTNMRKGNSSLPALLRTKDNSPAYSMFLSLGGKVVLNISRERVIMVMDS